MHYFLSSLYLSLIYSLIIESLCHLDILFGFYQENEKYLKAIKPVQQFFNLQKKRFSDRSHKYYRCPSCKQMVRLPKGKGKIIVTCPSCHQKFEKRT